MNYKVSAKRHLAKTISYRILSTGLGFFLMWYVSGSLVIGASFGVAEMLLKPALYYLHERTWYRWIKFGLIPEKKTTKKEVKQDLTKEVIEDIPKESKKTDSPSTKPKTKKTLNYNSNR